MKAWRYSGVLAFQSTPPCGGDLTDDDALIQDLIFQSTPPCGGDKYGERKHQLTTDISIHAPLRGRLPISMMVRAGRNFNPRPLAGATTQRW